MNAHTPGPWNYSTSQEGWSFDIYQAEDAAYTKESSDVATLFVRSVQCDPKETQEANARLIAAAPDLLEASALAFHLLNSVAFVSVTGDTEELLQMLQAAIAKATGQSA